MNIIKNILICVAVLFMAQISFSQAETGRKTPSLDGLENAGPCYNPASKSYFELIRMISGGEVKPQWRNAKKLQKIDFLKIPRGVLRSSGIWPPTSLLYKIFLQETSG